MQFTTTDRLEPAIALLSVVAVALLKLREAARRADADTRRADTLLSSDYVEVLSLKRYGTVRVDLKVREFFLALARLGGHQNRKSDGHPGWLVLWRGWMKLQAMLDGYLAAQRKICLALASWCARYQTQATFRIGSGSVRSGSSSS
jgi:hypothetical protein